MLNFGFEFELENSSVRFQALPDALVAYNKAHKCHVCGNELYCRKLKTASQAVGARH
jgi:hypothetical protein